MTNTTAAVLARAGGPFELQAVTLGDLRPGEVLVRNLASGICHTDILAQTRVPLPAVFGHEGAGVIEAVGPGVTRLKVGQRVVTSYPCCADCRACHDGAPYHCSHHMALAFSGCRLDGSTTMTRPDGGPVTGAFFQQSSFARHSIAQQQALVVVADAQSAELQAALACGVQTGAGAVLNTFQMGPTQAFAVFGVGAVGMSALMAAELCGVSPLVAIDVKPARLELARMLGATHVIDASTGEVARQLREISRRGFDFTLETSGVQQSLDDAILALATGGECGMVIAPRLGEAYPFSPSEIFTRAARLTGIIQGSAVPQTFIPQLLDLHRQGRFPFERLIKSYPFEDINRAFADVAAGDVIKPVLRME